MRPASVAPLAAMTAPMARLVGALCAVVFTAGGLSAQRVVARSDARAPVVPLASIVPPAPVVPPANAVGPITVEGAPRTYQVVSVDLPPALAAEEDVSYEVVPHGVRVLGSLTGVLHPRVGARRVVLTVRVPESAPAGRSPVADVVFRGARGTVVTTLDLRTPRARAAEVTPIRPLFAVSRGARVEVEFRVVSRGNATDTLEIVVEGSAGWRPRLRAAGPRVLAPGEEVVERVSVSAPAGLASGEGTVELAVRSGGVERGRGRATVRVAGSDAAASAWTVRTTAVLAAGTEASPGASAAAGVVADIRGQVGDARVLARVTARSDSAPATLRALQGIEPRSDRLAVVAGGTSAAVGAVAEATTDLTGGFVAGTGASLGLSRGPVRMRALVARPFAAAPTSPSVFGQLALEGTRIGAALSAVRVSASERATGGLRAASVGAWLAPAADARLSAEVGTRRYEGGSGLGLSGSARVGGERSWATLRTVFAPGGSAALAPASHSLDAQGALALGEAVRVSAQGWVSRDNASGTSVRSSGWAVDPEVAASPSVSLGAIVASRALVTDFGSGAARTDERQVGGQIRAGLGAARVGVQAVRVSETRTLAAGTDGARIGFARAQLRADASWEGAAGTIRGAVGVLSSGGWIAAQRTLALSVEGLHPVALPLGARLSAGIDRLAFGPQTLTTLRAGVSAELPRASRLTLEVERRPTLGSIESGAVTVALRLERTTSLPLPSGKKASGVAFRDLDGNGKRDRGEPGFEGLLVRRGAQVAVTDGQGRFHFTTPSAEAVVLDERSLPTGWVVGLASGVQGERIAVAPLGSATVEVRDASGALDGEAEVWVTLTDRTGHTWTARATDGRARFEGLPVGRYAIRARAGTRGALALDGPDAIEVAWDRPEALATLVLPAPKVKVLRAVIEEEAQ